MLIVNSKWKQALLCAVLVSSCPRALQVRSSAAGTGAGPADPVLSFLRAVGGSGGGCPLWAQCVRVQPPQWKDAADFLCSCAPVPSPNKWGGCRSQSGPCSSPGAAPSPLQQRQLALLLPPTPAAALHHSRFGCLCVVPGRAPVAIGCFERRRCCRSPGSARIRAAAGGKGEKEEEEFRLQ